jgi:hypothetical protein
MASLLGCFGFFDALDLLKVDKDSLKKLITGFCGFFAALGAALIVTGLYIAMIMVRNPTWGESAPGTTIFLGAWIVIWSLLGIVGASGEKVAFINFVSSGTIAG